MACINEVQQRPKTLQQLEAFKAQLAIQRAEEQARAKEEQARFNAKTNEICTRMKALLMELASLARAEEEEDSMPSEFGVESHPSMDAPQALDESPKRNPDIKSDDWVGGGQGKLPVGSQNAFCEQLDGLKPSNGSLENSGLYAQEEGGEDAKSEVCTDVEPLESVENLQTLQFGTVEQYQEILICREKAIMGGMNPPNKWLDQFEDRGWKETNSSYSFAFHPGEIVNKISGRCPLDAIANGVELASAEKLIRETMDSKNVLEGSLEWLKSVFGSDIEQPWSRTREFVLKENVDPWDDIFEDAFMSRMKVIIDSGFGNLTRTVNISGSIHVVGGSSDGCGDSAYLSGSSANGGAWFIEPNAKRSSFIPVAESSPEEYDFGSCLNAYFAPEVSHARDTVDSCCCSVLEDLLCFLESPKLVKVLECVVQIAAGPSYALAIACGGTVYLFGNNFRLGYGDPQNEHQPRAIFSSRRKGIHVVRVSASDGAFVEELPIEATLQRQPKKRKHGTVTVPPVAQHALFGSGVKASKDSPTSIALKIAAVEALEALLIVGGALRSDSWRRKVDHLLIEVATDAFRLGWTHDGKTFLPQEPKVTWDDFQLVALHALLASLLCPAGTRPPYLAQGLELFRKGKIRTGTKIAEFCAQALLALEVLVHPRALPLIDISSGMADFGGQKYKSQLTDGKIRTGNCGIPHDVYDFLNDVYLQNNSGSLVSPVEPNERVHVGKESVDIPSNQDPEPQNVINPSPNMSTASERGEGPTPIHNFQIGANGDRVMQDVEHYDDLNKVSQERELATAPEALLPASGSLAPKIGLEKDASDAETPAFPRRPSDSSGQASASIGFDSTSRVEGAVTARGDDNVFKLSAAEADDEESDSFPDIVDADPDTDSGSE